MRPTRSLAPLALAALGGLAIGACGLADVFRPAGLKNVVLTYCGDTLLAVGTREAVVVTVEANGAIIPNPRLSVSSSDSTFLALTPIGDTLVAKKSGDVLLTIRLVSSMVTGAAPTTQDRDRKSTRLNSSHGYISYAVFCLKKKKTTYITLTVTE